VCTRQVIGLVKLRRHPHASENFAELMGHFGQLTNALTFFFSVSGTPCLDFVYALAPRGAFESADEVPWRFAALQLFGTSYVVRKLGLPTTLRIFPCLLIMASVAAFLYPYLGVLFFFVSILKALSYALNEPCKEMLYIPTSDVIR
jgi:hypothetical protein